MYLTLFHFLKLDPFSNTIEARCRIIKMNSTIPATNPNASTTPAYRTNTYVWGLRFIQILFALIIVALGGSAISDWHSLGCSSPSKLSFNFAVVCSLSYPFPCLSQILTDTRTIKQGLITIFLLLYFVLSSGPYKHLLPWYSFYATLALEALFILLYIVAAALSTYDCSGLCNACAVPGAQVDSGYGYFVWVSDLTCFCWFSDDDVSFSERRDAPSRTFARGGGRSASGGRGGGSSNTANLGKTLEKGFSSATKKGLDATMMFVAFPSLFAWVLSEDANG